MEKEGNKVYFTDEKGQTTVLNILFTYDNKERNKEYVFFYSEEEPDNIIVGYLGDNGEILDIYDDEEYDELEDVLAHYEKDQEKKEG